MTETNDQVLKCLCGCGCRKASGPGESGYCRLCAAGCCGEDEPDVCLDADESDDLDCDHNDREHRELQRLENEDLG